MRRAKCGVVSDTSDERGRVLEEFLEQSSAVVINTGQPTYQHRSGSQSHLDVAIVSSDLATRASWTTLMGSDHSPTITSIGDTETQIQNKLPRFLLDRTSLLNGFHF